MARTLHRWQFSNDCQYIDRISSQLHLANRDIVHSSDGTCQLNCSYPRYDRRIVRTVRLRRSGRNPNDKPRNDRQSSRRDIVYIVRYVDHNYPVLTRQFYRYIRMADNCRPVLRDFHRNYQSKLHSVSLKIKSKLKYSLDYIRITVKVLPA